MGGVTRGADRNPALVCGHVFEDGRRCNAYRVRGSEPPRCYRHSISEEEWRDKARLGGLGRKRKLAEENDLWERYRHPSFQPEVLEQAAQVVKDLLRARVEYLGTPDLPMRALGVYLGLHLFRLLPEEVSQLEDPPAQLLEALERADLDRVPLETFGLSASRTSSEEG